MRAVIHEMRPVRPTAVHKTDRLAELVCSNSFRGDKLDNAVGLLKEEMRRLGSLIMQAADANRVPAGAALAVDRERFAQAVTDAVQSHPLISVVREEMHAVPRDASFYPLIIATGPLTSPALASAVQALTGEESLAFFDAIAPIVHKGSIDFGIAWYQSRYDKHGPGGDGADYINCPLTRDEYEAFIAALISGGKTEFKEFEKTPYFEACLPIEVMAERGAETLRFGPMKPVGLTNPRAPDVKPYAVVQLRQDNALGTLYNMVGFQTKLRHGEQTRIFRTIPGLANAQFARLGGLHRNTFLNSPRLLDDALRLKAMPRLRFAGQITGVEGYVESAAIGLLAGRFAASERLGTPLVAPPPTTALGALLHHITGGADAQTFQPMNVNFGLFPPLEEKVHARGKEKGRARKTAMSERALRDLDAWLGVKAQAAE